MASLASSACCWRNWASLSSAGLAAVDAALAGALEDVVAEVGALALPAEFILLHRSLLRRADQAGREEVRAAANAEQQQESDDEVAQPRARHAVVVREHLGHRLRQSDAEQHGRRRDDRAAGEQ